MLFLLFKNVFFGGFEGKDIKLLIRRMQVKSISGSVKNSKAFLNFNDFNVFRALLNIFRGTFLWK